MTLPDIKAIKAVLEEAGFVKDSWNHFLWSNSGTVCRIKWRWNVGRVYYVRVKSPDGELADCHDLASLRKAVGL